MNREGFAKGDGIIKEDCNGSARKEGFIRFRSWVCMMAILDLRDLVKKG